MLITIGSTDDSENDGDGGDDDDDNVVVDDDNREFNLIDHPRRPPLHADALGGVVTNISDRSATTPNDADDYVEVVDVEQADEYGLAQYSEADVVPFLSVDVPNDVEERLAIREAILREGNVGGEEGARGVGEGENSNNLASDHSE